MGKEIIACLDGSTRAEAILPLAQGVAAPMGAGLSILRVAADANELPAAEIYMREQARLYGARLRLIIAPDPADAIIEELRQSAGAMVAMTTHGRTAWMEAIVGSVALKVVRGARRPVLLYRPATSAIPRTIETIIVALDGGEFAEQIIPFAVDFAGSVKARLVLVQVVPVLLKDPMSPLPQTDILESSYLHSIAAEIKRKHGAEASWDTLHGEPAQAISRFVKGMPNTMLALASRARAGLERTLVGSVAATCLRNANVPLLLYWPGGETSA